MAREWSIPSVSSTRKTYFLIDQQSGSVLAIMVQSRTPPFKIQVYIGKDKSSEPTHHATLDDARAWVDQTLRKQKEGEKLIGNVKVTCETHCGHHDGLTRLHSKLQEHIIGQVLETIQYQPDGLLYFGFANGMGLAVELHTDPATGNHTIHFAGPRPN